MKIDSVSLTPAVSVEKQQQHSPKSGFAKLCRKLSSRKSERSVSSPTRSACSSELEKVFEYFDENGDGKISPAELQTCVRNVGGELSEEAAQVAVEASDLDGDGLLGFEEFQKLMEGAGANGDAKDKSKELRDAFAMYEMEGSGCITPTSLKRMLARLGESRSVEDCKNMIRMFDLNEDGVLNFEEFKTMMA